jgi:uncharacterized protein (TIGR03067 family)
MSARIACLLIALLPLAAWAAGADDAAKNKLAPLQGGWKFESMEAEGEKAELFDTAFWWFIKDDKVLYGGKELATLTVDPETTPKCFDITMHESKRSYEGIYILEDDTLKICLNPVTDGAKERPGDFTTKGKSSTRLLTFKRDKERKADSIEGLAGFVGVQIKVDDDSKQVVVVTPIPNSPAEKAGLLKDDIILKIGDQDATDLKGTINLIRKVKPGGELTLRVKRDGKEKDFTVKATVIPFYLLDA